MSAVSKAGNSNQNLGPLTWKNDGQNLGKTFREYLEYKHPRQADVSNKIDAAEGNIRHDMKTGQISKQQGKKELAKLHQVQKQGEAEVRYNHGFITADQKKSLMSEVKKVDSEVSKLESSKHNHEGKPGAGTPHKNQGPLTWKGDGQGLSKSQRDHLEKEHPRQAKVEKKISAEEKRLHQEIASGNLSKSESRNDRAELAKLEKIRHEGGDMVRKNGGYITQSQKQHLLAEVKQAEGGTAT